MFLKKIMFVVTAVSLLLGAAAARAQDNGALLDLLVKKGLITDQEAEEVRADLVKENAATSAGKLKLSTPVTELELYGDARVRYEVRSGETAAPDTHQLARRYLSAQPRPIPSAHWVERDAGR